MVDCLLVHLLLDIVRDSLCYGPCSYNVHDPAAIDYKLDDPSPQQPTRELTMALGLRTALDSVVRPVSAAPNSLPLSVIADLNSAPLLVSIGPNSAP